MDFDFRPVIGCVALIAMIAGAILLKLVEFLANHVRVGWH